jgi:hypothetical protein
MSGGSGRGQGPQGEDVLSGSGGSRTGSEGSEHTHAPAPTGWATHLERLAAARREHRHRMATRLWYAAIPVGLAVILAMALLSVFGGFDREQAALTPAPTVARQPVEGSGLLLIEDDGVLLSAVVVQPSKEGGLVLGVPGITLLEWGGGFHTVAELYGSGKILAVEQAVSEAFEVILGPAAVVGWSDLSAAMRAAGVQGAAPAAAESEPAPSDTTVVQASPVSDAETLALEIKYFMAAGITDLGSNLWYDLDLEGNAAGFVDAVMLDAGSMATSEWAASCLEGFVTEGEGFIYLEPDVEATRTLLGADGQEVATSVEVRDGAGVVGAPELAGDMLESAGYQLTPMSYAEAFPQVERTQIMVSPGNVEEAERVRSLLGVGDIVEDETLEASILVVVLGKDFGQGAQSETGTVE